MTTMAETLVLLRGLARGRHHWGGFVDLVRRSLPDCRVVCLDLAGNGDRFREPSPSDIHQAVADIRGQLQCRYSSASPCHVLGLSLGGMIALQWLHDYPDEVAQAVVINTSHAGLCDTRQRMQPGAMWRLLAAAWLPPAASERLILSLTMNTRPSPAWLAHCVRLSRTQPVTSANLYRQVKVARSFDTALDIDPPRVLLVASEKDRLADAGCSRAIADHFGFAFASHPTAGHELPMDDGPWLAGTIKTFLR